MHFVGMGKDRVQLFTVAGWPAPRRKDWRADATRGSRRYWHGHGLFKQQDEVIRMNIAKV